MSRTGRLAILRARTDQELLVLIQRELDRALAQPNVAEARNIYDKMFTLLNGSVVPQAERARLEAALNELRLKLDQAATVSKAQRRTASFAA